jgi:uncharacterized protein with HEPN domain
LRDKNLYADDIISSIEYIFEYVKGMEFEDFKEDRKTFLAVVKELEIIGEAIKHIKDDLKKIDKSYPYEQIVGFRNISVHEYFGINYTIVWNVIFYELPQLNKIMKKFLKETK